MYVKSCCPWNLFPGDIVNVPSINTFENRQDRFWFSGLSKFNYKAPFFWSSYIKIKRNVICFGNMFEILPRGCLTQTIRIKKQKRDLNTRGLELCFRLINLLAW